MHLVGWDKVIRPKEEVGLGIPVTRPRNLALVAKLGWRLKTKKDKSWAKVMAHKYRNPAKPCSRTCRAIKTGKEICDKGSMWLIGANNKLLCLGGL